MGETLLHASCLPTGYSRIRIFKPIRGDALLRLGKVNGFENLEKEL